LAGNGKINHEKGMFDAAALTFPFQDSTELRYGYEQKMCNTTKWFALQ